MNKFLTSSSSGGISEDRVREIIEDTSVIYNNDSSVSINNSSNASLYTLPTVGGVPGNSVVVSQDSKHLVFANAGSSGLTNPLVDSLDAGGNAILQLSLLRGIGLGPDLMIDSHVNMLNYTMKNLTSLKGSGGKLDILNTNLHMNSGVIYNASAVVGAGLTNDLLLSGSITLNGDINMANNTLNNVRNVSKSDINLSLIPATTGSAGQVLSCASNFNIADPLTAQLVWTTPVSSGVTNPMTAHLDAGIYSITNASVVEARTIRTIGNGSVRTDIISSQTTSGLQLVGMTTTNNTLTNIQLSAPNIYLNNQYDPLTPSTHFYINGLLEFNNPVATPTIVGDNFHINGRDAKGNPTTISSTSSFLT